MKDLVVLVADGHQQAVVETLLKERHQALQIRKMQEFEIFAHPQRDPGVYRDGGAFLSPFAQQYKYALVMLDAEWEGGPGATKIKEKIENDLNSHGWQNSSGIIVIEPELEIWVWSSSPEVEKILGQTMAEIRSLGEKRNWWTKGSPKPHRPKELMEAVLRQGRKKPSAAIFKRLAAQVSLRRCQDTSFQELKQKLQAWFP